MNFEVADFYSYHKYRPKHKKAKKSSGGIYVLIKKHISAGIKILENSNSDLIWLQLDKNYFNMHEDLYICSLYISPKILLTQTDKMTIYIAYWIMI